MPEVEEVSERPAGAATTEQVQIVGEQRRVTLPLHGHSLELNLAPASAGSIAVITTASSPWWSNRLLEQLTEPLFNPLAPEAGGRGGLMSVYGDDAALLRASSEFALRAPRRWNLDFGRNVTPAFGTDVAALLELVLGSARQRIQSEWLRADPPETVAAAQAVADDAEWDNSDDSPRWLSMSALSYRGGGVMRRRARRVG